MSFGNSYQNLDIGLTALRKAAKAAESVVDVVLVTTPGYPRAKEWALCELHGRVKSIGNANIYAYEAWSSFEDDFRWETLLRHGESLVKILARRYNSSAEDSSVRPIILIGHSLAAFIIKKCLILVYTQKAKYILLRDVIAGVVFLGCPHTCMPETRSMFIKKTLKILEHAMERRGQRIRNMARLESDFDLIDICTQFDAMGGNVKISTFYETMNTKVSRGFRPSSMLKLVDVDLAKVDRTKHEKLVEIQSDHYSLPLMNHTALIQGWSETAIGHIQSLIVQAQELYRRIPSQDAEPDFEDTGLEPLIRDLETGRPHLKTSSFLVDMSRQRNTDFQGREAVLGKLKQHLLDKPQVALLYGKGGLGKSETAIEFAHRHHKDFDAVLWVQADDLSKLRQDFGAFAAKLGLEPEDAVKDPFISRELVKDWLKDPIKMNISGQGSLPAKWLVIFDGVDTMETLKEFEMIYGRGSILMTSRNPNLFAAFNRDRLSWPKDRRINIYAENLDLFSESEGAAVLKRLADMNEDADEQTAREIVGLVEGWPLAIRQMAGIIRNNDLTLPEFYERFKSERRGAYAEHGSERDTMMLSIRMANLSPNAIAVLRVCAMLDPDCIQESLFVMESAVEGIIEDFPLNAQRFEDARNELLNASLVSRNEEKHEFWMHRVVQDAVRELTLCTSGAFDVAFRFAASLVRQAWQPVPASVRDNLKLWEPCAAHLRHVLHLQQVYLVTTSAKSPGRPSRIKPCFPFAWLLHEVGCFQRGLGDTSGIESTLGLALSICELLPSKKVFHLLCEVYHGLGAWANETNHAEACLKYNTLYVQLWKDALEGGEPATERTAAAWNQYATGLTMARRYREAMTAYERSIKLYAELALDIPCPDSLPVVNLGVVKWLIGEHESAWTILTTGQEAREASFGFMDTKTFRSGRFYHALGNVCFDQGNLPKSEYWHTQALDQYIQSLGPRHHRTADVCHRVAIHCLRRGDFKEAGSLIDQALGSWSMDASSFKPEIARTKWLKARQLRLSGNHAAAVPVQDEAVKLRAELRPGDKRLAKHLTDEDFDDLVAFWSR